MENRESSKESMLAVWKVYPRARCTSLPSLDRKAMVYGIIDSARIQNAELSELHPTESEAWNDAAFKLPAPIEDAPTQTCWSCREPIRSCGKTGWLHDNAPDDDYDHEPHPVGKQSNDWSGTQPSAAPESAEPRIQELPPLDVTQQDRYDAISLEPTEPDYRVASESPWVRLACRERQFREVVAENTRLKRTNTWASDKRVMKMLRERAEKAEAEVERLSPKASEWMAEVLILLNRVSPAMKPSGRANLSRAIALLEHHQLPAPPDANQPRKPSDFIAELDRRVAAITASGKCISDTAVRQLKEER